MVHPDEKSGKECLVAFVSPPNVDMQALDLTFRKKYPLYMVPALFHGVERIPRLRNGQVCILPQPPSRAPLPPLPFLSLSLPPLRSDCILAISLFFHNHPYGITPGREPHLSC